MALININMDNTIGKIKPMHAVNNGPVKAHCGDQAGNLSLFRDAGFPYARTHDSVFNNDYGGAHTVDWHLIFPNFEADENDPSSYDFACTDKYMADIFLAGCTPFYRLGASIEQGVKKYGTIPPKDFHKWARIAEHIIAHYTEGWAEGFYYNMPYWEIWNEPDLGNLTENFERSSTWGGSPQMFFDFFEISVRHLKSRFPHLKIGGPALTSYEKWFSDFLDFLARDKNDPVPLDFLSYHRYVAYTVDMIPLIRFVRSELDKRGFNKTEAFIDEWNFITGWDKKSFMYSLKEGRTSRGAAFAAAVMCACHKEPVDMLMYYNASPACGLCGIFDIFYEPFKTYYSFNMFNKLYQLGTEFSVSCDDKNIFTLGAKNEEGDFAVLASLYYEGDLNDSKSDDFSVLTEVNSSDAHLETKLIEFNLGRTYESIYCYLVDDNNDMQEVPLFIHNGIYSLKVKENSVILLSSKSVS